MYKKAAVQFIERYKPLSALLLTLIFLVSINAQAQLGYGNYIKIQELTGYPEDFVKVNYANTDLVNSFTVQNRNMCPLSYNGGQLYMATDAWSFLTKGKIENGDLYAYLPAFSPYYLYEITIDSPIYWMSSEQGGPGGPLPTNGSTLMFTYVPQAAVYIHQMGCYFTGCSVGQRCQMNPYEVTAINIDKSIDLKVESIVIEQPEGTPVKVVDGKAVLVPDEQAVAVVSVSAANAFPNDWAYVSINAVYEGRSYGRDVVQVSDLASGPKKLSFYLPYYLNNGDDKVFSFEIGYSLRHTNELYEDDMSNNSISQTVTFQGEKPELKIENARLAQVVFDPMTENIFGATEPALVSGKAFAIELTLSSYIPAEYVNSVATAQIYIDGVAAGEAVDFKPSDISTKRNNLYLYAKTDLEGEHSITAKIRSKSGPIPSVLDSQNEIESSPIVRKFYRTQLNLLVGQITGCASGSSCFVPPTTSDIAMYNGDQRTLAAQLMPVAPSNITYKDGASITDSSTSGLLWWARLKDMLKIATIKHKEKQDAAIYLVNDSYMRKMGLELPDEDGEMVEVYGYTLTPLHVGYVDARTRIAFTHELFHALGRAGHSSEVLPAGINVDIRRIYNLVLQPLADNFTVFRAANLMLSSPPTREGDEYTPDHSSYGRVLYSILHKGFDPKIIYVTGIIDENEKVVWSEHTRMETILDEQTGTEIEIRGLDSGGHIVASALTAAITSAEKFGSNGATIDEFPGYAFATTLIDPGNVAQIQVIKAGRVVSVSNVAETKTLREIMDKLIKSDFKSALFASAELRILKDEFSSYLKLVEKKRRVEAKATLVLLKLTAALSLKSSFALSDGTTMTLSDFLKKVDAEINSIK